MISTYAVARSEIGFTRERRMSATKEPSITPKDTVMTERRSVYPSPDRKRFGYRLSTFSMLGRRRSNNLVTS
jgi:hypothetical protein